MRRFRFCRRSRRAPTKVYELQTYELKPGGLPPTLAGWEAAMPAREPMSHLVINMYVLDGAPRIMHIWPYSGVDERVAIRAKSYAEGIWPPKGDRSRYWKRLRRSFCWSLTHRCPEGTVGHGGKLRRWPRSCECVA